MSEYHKIDSPYKRGPDSKFTDEFSRPEFEYLAEADWDWTEKVDGTNIRLYVPGPGDFTFEGYELVYIKGRTDNAQIPPKLLLRLVELMRTMPLRDVFDAEAVLYGEGYGAGIQSGGKYSPTPEFVLFDVKVGDWWLKRDAVDEIAGNLGIASVPVVGRGSLYEAIDFVAAGFESQRWPGVQAEGLVIRPSVDLLDRGGRRIITKLKTRDFR